MIFFSTGIGKLTKITSLNLNLSENKFRENGLNFLSNEIRNIKKMQDLNINLKNTYLGDL